MALALDEVSLKLKDLRQAISLERSRRFPNVQGRRQTFSAFVYQTVRSLRGWLLTLSAVEEEAVDGVIRQFDRYSELDVGARMDAVQRLEALLAPPEPPKPKATDAAAPDIGTMSVQFLRGVGPRLAQQLRLVGIETVAQLLHYYPRRYLDYQQRARIADLVEGQEVTVIGTIRGVNAHPLPNRNLSVMSLTVTDDTGVIGASWFFGKTQPAVLETYKRSYPVGAEVMLSGRVKWDEYRKRLSMDRPVVEILSYADVSEEPSSLHAGRIVPVYSLTEGLNLRMLRRAIHQALSEFVDGVPDLLPDSLRRQYDLIPLPEALRHIHFPETRAHHEAARRRLVFDELFFLQGRMALVRLRYKQNSVGLSLPRQAGGFCDRLLASLPFSLTGSQQRVFDEICQDLASPEPMYRLLQGDVGSGKTVVALLTLLVGLDNGYQGAMMVPTEILAEQHYRRFVEWMTPLGVRVGLVVGKAGAKERRDIRQGLQNGQIQLAVGTHALIQDDVGFANLGVVVVDEQHRFGVRQRSLLKGKGGHPEMLTMTATPIPRTLALSLHGDLDLSILDERPPGRHPIRTSVLQGRQRSQAEALIRQAVVQGRQAYVVVPMIEDSETLAAKAATTEAERLQQEVFPEFRVGLLHGKLRPEEKDGVMTQFAAGHLDVLVSTTVVEVGVDVPNATVMVIENADRFGLAQLHQLRGRVGRGQFASYCVLLCETRSPDVLERLAVLAETEDGFQIADRDLALRGPGEFLGTRQSGLPDLVLADLIEDRALLEAAREAAKALVEDPAFPATHPALYAAILEKTERQATLMGAG